MQYIGMNSVHVWIDTGFSQVVGVGVQSVVQCASSRIREKLPQFFDVRVHIWYLRQFSLDVLTGWSSQPKVSFWVGEDVTRLRQLACGGNTGLSAS